MFPVRAPLSTPIACCQDEQLLLVTYLPSSPPLCTHPSIPRLPQSIEGHPLTTIGSPHHASSSRPGLGGVSPVRRAAQESRWKAF